MKINGKTIDEFIEMITQERTVSFWGDQYTFTPVVCPKIIGDGQQIIYFGTIDQRPFWWYVRIDSKTNVESEDFNHEDIVDLLEDYYGVCDPELSEAEFEEIKQKGRDFCEEMYPADYYLYDRIMEAESYNKWYDEYTQYPRVEYSGGHWGLATNFGTGEILDQYRYLK
ncbi:hypothetical protein QIU19_13305 [Capnocytophaga canimorsus]|nr:hypothetical protein [Capnocytophaga canimorsus]WGU68222.1 hypothetical protein QIU19_13305 [Capnocytophaga canimorsus]